MCFQSDILMLGDLSPSKPWDYFELLNVQWKLVIPSVRAMVLNWAWIVIDWKLKYNHVLYLKITIVSWIEHWSRTMCNQKK
jgi:hypothetical protein